MVYIRLCTVYLRLYTVYIPHHRRWAARCGRSPHAVTLAAADALLAEWRRCLWGDAGLRAALWAELAALFAGAGLPRALGARWLAARARALAAEGAVELPEQLALLQARPCPGGVCGLINPIQDTRVDAQISQGG